MSGTPPPPPPPPSADVAVDGLRIPSVAGSSASPSGGRGPPPLPAASVVAFDPVAALASIGRLIAHGAPPSPPPAVAATNMGDDDDDDDDAPAPPALPAVLPAAAAPAAAAAASVPSAAGPDGDANEEDDDDDDAPPPPPPMPADGELDDDDEEDEDDDDEPAPAPPPLVPSATAASSAQSPQQSQHTRTKPAPAVSQHVSNVRAGFAEFIRAKKAADEARAAALPPSIVVRPVKPNRPPPLPGVPAAQATALASASSTPLMKPQPLTAESLEEIEVIAPAVAHIVEVQPRLASVSGTPGDRLAFDRSTAAFASAIHNSAKSRAYKRNSATPMLLPPPPPPPAVAEAIMRTYTPSPNLSSPSTPSAAALSPSPSPGDSSSASASVTEDGSGASTVSLTRRATVPTPPQLSPSSVQDFASITAVADALQQSDLERSTGASDGSNSSRSNGGAAVRHSPRSHRLTAMDMDEFNKTLAKASQQQQQLQQAPTNVEASPASLLSVLERQRKDQCTRDELNSVLRELAEGALRSASKPSSLASLLESGPSKASHKRSASSVASIESPIDCVPEGSEEAGDTEADGTAATGEQEEGEEEEEEGEEEVVAPDSAVMVLWDPNDPMFAAMRARSNQGDVQLQPPPPPPLSAALLAESARDDPPTLLAMDFDDDEHEEEDGVTVMVAASKALSRVRGASMMALPPPPPPPPSAAATTTAEAARATATTSTDTTPMRRDSDDPSSSALPEPPAAPTGVKPALQLPPLSGAARNGPAAKPGAAPAAVRNPTDVAALAAYSSAEGAALAAKVHALLMHGKASAKAKARPLDLASMLRHNIGYRFLLIQCYREYSEENVLACKAIEGYRKKSTFAALAAIHDKYIRDGADLMINISSATRKDTTSFVERWRANEVAKPDSSAEKAKRKAEMNAMNAALPTTLDRVEAEILALLERDTIKRMKLSILYQCYVAGAQPPTVLSRTADPAEDLALLTSVGARPMDPTELVVGLEFLAQQQGGQGATTAGSAAAFVSSIESTKITSANNKKLRPAFIKTHKADISGMGSDAAAAAQTAAAAAASSGAAGDEPMSATDGGGGLLDRWRNAFRGDKDKEKEKEKEKDKEPTKDNQRPALLLSTPINAGGYMSGNNSANQPHSPTTPASSSSTTSSARITIEHGIHGSRNSSFTGVAPTERLAPTGGTLANGQKGRTGPPPPPPAGGNAGPLSPPALPPAHHRGTMGLAGGSAGGATASAGATAGGASAVSSSLSSSSASGADFGVPLVIVSGHMPALRATTGTLRAVPPPLPSSFITPSSASAASTAPVSPVSSGAPPSREVRPTALVPLLHQPAGFRFFLAFLYARGDEVPLLAWKACSIFAWSSSLSSLQFVWDSFLDPCAPQPLPLELVSLERRAVLQEYLLAVDSGEAAPSLPIHAETHPKGFGAMLLPVQADLKVHLAGQLAMMLGTPLWRAYVGGLLPPAELKRARDDAHAASAAGMAPAEAARTAAASAASSAEEQADTPAELQKRVECIERILAEAARMGDWKSDED